MKRGVIFNVGSGLCAYLNIDGKKVLIDCGRGKDFHPINDFLLPIAQNDRWESDSANRHYLDYFILSHPHQDHISGIVDLMLEFHPRQSMGVGSDLKDVDWDKFDQNNQATYYLKTIFQDYTTSPCQEGFVAGIWRIPPKVVEKSDYLQTENGYQNNISEIVLLNINGTRILFPGDIQTAGIEYLLDQDAVFSSTLAEAPLDFLVAPHHGHKSSFTPAFFEHLAGKKTRCLNIIPEDRERADEKHVAGEYYIGDYCCGKNNLTSTNGATANYGRKTSEGHICIDFEQAGNPTIEIIKDAEDLVGFFIEDHFMWGLTGDLGWH